MVQKATMTEGKFMAAMFGSCASAIVSGFIYGHPISPAFWICGFFSLISAVRNR